MHKYLFVSEQREEEKKHTELDPLWQEFYFLSRFSRCLFLTIHSISTIRWNDEGKM